MSLDPYAVWRVHQWHMHGYDDIMITHMYICTCIDIGGSMHILNGGGGEETPRLDYVLVFTCTDYSHFSKLH